MAQLELLPNIPISTRPGSIAQRFLEFHILNPHVYRNLVVLAREVRAQDPFAQIGICTLYEVTRWKYRLETTVGEDQYKLNNDFRSRYARLIMAQEPDLKGIFEIRKLKNIA